MIRVTLANERTALRWVTRADKLSRIEWAVYVALLQRVPNIHPSVATIARDAHYSSRAEVRKALDALEAKRLIGRTYRRTEAGDDDTCIYELFMPEGVGNSLTHPGDVTDPPGGSMRNPPVGKPATPKKARGSTQRSRAQTKSLAGVVDIPAGSARGRGRGRNREEALLDQAYADDAAGLLTSSVKAVLMRYWPQLAASRTDNPGSRPGYPKATRNLPPRNEIDPADIDYHSGSWVIGELCPPDELAERGLA